MKKCPLLLALLAAQTTFAQFNTRTVSSKPSLPAYDSTVNLHKLFCQFDAASLVGQEIWFGPRTAHGREVMEDTLHYFESEKQTPLNNAFTEQQKAQVKSGQVRYEKVGIRYNYKWGDNNQTNCYKPCVNIFTQYAQKSMTVHTPYSALENKSFKIVKWETEGGDDCVRRLTLQDESGEIFYWQMLHRLRANMQVFVKGYLERFKRLYVNRNVYFHTDISYTPMVFTNTLDKKEYEYTPGSKWKCTDLTFLDEGDDYFGHPALILQDSAKNEIAVLITPGGQRMPDDKFLTQSLIMTEEKYLAQRAKEKMERDAALAKEKAEKLKMQKELAAERARLIKEYGAEKGDLISKGIIKIGFTTDMCRDAWGMPDNTLNSNVGGNSYEAWIYRYSRWLKFRNGKLIAVWE